LLCLNEFIDQTEERQKELLISPFKRVSVSEDPMEVGKKGKEKARLKHQVKGGSCRPLLQIPDEFVPNARGGTFSYLLSIANDGLVRCLLDRKPGSGGMANDANHSNRVLLKPFIRVADGADDLSLKIGHSADIVDDGEIGDVVEEAVHGDVSAEGIFLGCSEAVRSNDLPLFRDRFFEFRVTAKRGDFDDLPSLEKDLYQSESAADRAAVPEEKIDFVRVGVGGDIEIFRGLPQKEIANTSSDEIGQKTMSMEAVKDFECLLINHLPGNRVLRPWNDKRCHDRSSHSS